MTTAAYEPNMVDLLAAPASLARELAEISWRRMAYWDARGLVRPGVRRKLSPARFVSLYNFDDLVALLVLAKLRRRNMSLQQLRSVVEHLRSRGYEKPLVELTFATHGREIYFQHPDGTWEGGRVPDQTVIREVIPLEAIRSRILQGLPTRQARPGETEKVRGRVGSKPVFAGTRIPVSTVARWIEHGASVDDILNAYPQLQAADIERARREVPVASV